MLLYNIYALGNLYDLCALGYLCCQCTPIYIFMGIAIFCVEDNTKWDIVKVHNNKNATNL